MDEKKLSEECYRLTTRSQSIYVPQIDDQVRFFFQGYEQFLYYNMKRLNLTIPDNIEDYRLMPHIYD